MRHIITLCLACLALGMTPLAFADSTEVVPPNGHIMKPIGVIDTNDCMPSTPVIAVVQTGLFGIPTAKDLTPPNSNCPTGFTSAGMNATIKSSTYNGMPATVYLWQSNCCREVITYQTPA